MCKVGKTQDKNRDSKISYKDVDGKFNHLTSFFGEVYNISTFVNCSENMKIIKGVKKNL